MVAELAKAWAEVPADIKSYAIGMAANISYGLFRGKQTEQQRRFERAFNAALKAFVLTLEIKDGDVLRTKFEDPKIRGLLLGLLANPANSKNVEELVISMGIDPADKKVAPAVAAFHLYFEEESLEGADPLNWLMYLRMQAFFSTAEAEQAPFDQGALRKMYLTHIREEFGRLTFKGYTKGKAISIPLDEIFTAPEFGTDVSEMYPFLDKVRRSDMPSFFQESSVGLVQSINGMELSINALFRCHLAVITGGPGAGKSTFFKYLAYCLASQDESEGASDILPIIFPISAYSEKRRKFQGGAYTIKEFLSDYWKEKYLDDPVPLFEYYWRRGRALFLIDGLDEVIDEGERQTMVSQVRHFIMAIMRAGPEFNRFYISCRTASYSGASQFEQINENVFRRFEIQRFNDSQIDHFLHSWYCWYERDFHNRKDTYNQRASAKRDEILATLKHNANIMDLATNPLMLTILCLIEHEGGRLPNSRAELYSECLRILSGAWENLRSLWKRGKIQYSLGDRIITEGMVIDFFGAVAFKMHEEAEKEVSEKELLTQLTKSFSRRQPDPSIARDQADEFIEIMRERSGLLDSVKPETFGFLHQTFREYLAARWLAESVNYMEKLGDYLLKPEWREVVLLLAASLPSKEASQFIWKLMIAGDERHDQLCLAEACLVDMGTDRISHSAYTNLLPEIQELFEKEANLPNKVVIGCILGRIEDYNMKFEEFIPIEGGFYNLEDLGECELQPFEIGRYLVTNHWYMRFLGEIEEGYSMEARPGFINNPVYNCPTAPVTGINCKQAISFCRWLTQKNDGYSYFLPSCEQWQAAAAGKEKRKYPWGNDIQMNRCNTIETNIRRPSPVDMFPDSATPEGLFDMAGNLWEWTSTEEQGQIILKGGGWNNSRYDARCAMHERGWSSGGVSRNSEIGFRCCRSKIIR